MSDFNPGKMSRRDSKPDDPKEPKCPHCDVQPCVVGMRIISFGGPDAMAAVFMCGSCDRILSVAPLPRIQPAPVPPERRSSLVVVP